MWLLSLTAPHLNFGIGFVHSIDFQMKFLDNFLVWFLFSGQILLISRYCPLDGLSVFCEGPHGEGRGKEANNV